MDLNSVSDKAAALLVLIALMAAALGWLRWLRPKIRRGSAVWGALVELLFGRPEEPQNQLTGAARQPSVPGAGMRLAQIETTSNHQGEQLVLLTDAVAKLVDAHERLDNHESRIKQLEDQTIERIAGKAESVSAWRAIEAVAKNTDPTTPTIEEKP